MRLCYLDNGKKSQIVGLLHIPRASDDQIWCFPRGRHDRLAYTEADGPTCPDCEAKLKQWRPEVKRVSAMVKAQFPELYQEAEKRLESKKRLALEDGKE